MAQLHSALPVLHPELQDVSGLIGEGQQKNNEISRKHTFLWSTEKMTEVRCQQVFKYILKNVAVVVFQNFPLYLLSIADRPEALQQMALSVARQ